MITRTILHRSDPELVEVFLGLGDTVGSSPAREPACGQRFRWATKTSADPSSWTGSAAAGIHAAPAAGTSRL